MSRRNKQFLKGLALILLVWAIICGAVTWASVAHADQGGINGFLDQVESTTGLTFEDTKDGSIVGLSLCVGMGEGMSRSEAIRRMSGTGELLGVKMDVTRATRVVDAAIDNLCPTQTPLREKR